MDLVDSKERKLEPPEVLVYAAATNNGLVPAGGETPYPVHAMISAIAAETEIPGTDVKQFGNTLFIAHRGKGANRNKMAGRALNADTGRNFLNNSLQYISYLQKKGITHYSTSFGTDGNFLNAFKLFQRLTKGIDTKIAIGKHKRSGEYMAFILIGEDPIPTGV